MIISGKSLATVYTCMWASDLLDGVVDGVPEFLRCAHPLLSSGHVVARKPLPLLRSHNTTVCVCVCMCVCEIEKGRGSKKQR